MVYSRNKVIKAFRVLNDLNKDRKPNIFSSSLYKNNYKSSGKNWLLKRYREYTENNQKWPSKVRIGTEIELAISVYNYDRAYSSLNDIGNDFKIANIDRVLKYIRDHDRLTRDNIIRNFERKSALGSLYLQSFDDNLDFIDFSQINEALKILERNKFVFWDYEEDEDVEFVKALRIGPNSLIDFKKFSIGEKYGDAILI